MKASALFKQYVWLVGTISRAGRITLREINDRWLRTEMSEGIPFSRTTFRRRWYLLGRLEYGGFLTLSFDRIQEMAMTDRTFVLDKDFDAQAYFSNYYGICRGETSRNSGSFCALSATSVMPCATCRCTTRRKSLRSGMTTSISK